MDNKEAAQAKFEASQETGRERLKVMPMEVMRLISTVSTGGLFLMPLAIERLDNKALVFSSGVCFLLSIIFVLLFSLLWSASLKEHVSPKYEEQLSSVKTAKQSIFLFMISTLLMPIGCVIFLIAVGLETFN